MLGILELQLPMLHGLVLLHAAMKMEAMIPCQAEDLASTDT